jgi:SNF2 family DNA or RNA helicase
MKTELLSYQAAGAQFLYDNRGGICAFRVGRGKTPTALAVLERIKADTPKPRFLVLCPSVLKYQWQTETTKFADNLITQVIDGTKLARSKQFSEQADVYIANYEQLRLDPIHFLSDEWDAVIMDEAHKLGNPTTKQSKIARKIKAKWKICLTGTPISNHPSELWPLLNWIAPDVAGKWWDFVHTYCTFNPWGGVSGTKNLDKLAKLVEPYMLMENEDIGLAEEIEADVEFDLSDAEVKLYEQIRLVTLQEIERELIDKVSSPAQIQNAFVKALRLQQLTGGMQLLGQGVESSKIKAIVELLANREGKAIIYSRFAEMGKLLYTKLAEYKPFIVIGETNKKDRQAIIDAFNKQDDPHRLLIISDTMSHGVNLQHACSTIIYCETPYSLGKKTQITGRVHRYGQKEQVYIYYMLARVAGRKSIDHHIKHISIRKSGVARKALGIRDITEILS